MTDPWDELYASQSGVESVISSRLISFVIIARNEHDMIGASIESVLRAAELLPSWECIFVDSDSEDKTAEIACGYPVTVVRLTRATRLTAGTGRYVGTRHASGDYVMFLDGDCELQPGFVEKALEALERDRSLSTVVGTRGTVYNRGEDEASGGGEIIWAAERDCEVVSTGGIAMIRKQYLDEVGGFSTVMISNEERELCLRLRAAGYRIRCIPHPMMVHYGHRWQAGETSYSELHRRFRSGLMEGPGQLLRQALDRRRLSKDHFEPGVNRALGFMGWCVLGAAAAATLPLGRPLWFGAWLAVTVGLYGLFAAKSRSLSRATYYVYAWALQAIAIVAGFRRGYRPPRGHEPGYEVLKVADPVFKNRTDDPA